MPDPQILAFRRFAGNRRGQPIEPIPIPELADAVQGLRRELRGAGNSPIRKFRYARHSPPSGLGSAGRRVRSHLEPYRCCSCGRKASSPSQTARREVLFTSGGHFFRLQTTNSRSSRRLGITLRMASTFWAGYFLRLCNVAAAKAMHSLTRGTPKWQPIPANVYSSTTAV